MKKPRQLKLIKEAVTHAYENYPIYRKKMDEAGIRPQDIKDLSDFERIPFTTKSEISNEIDYDILIDNLGTDLCLLGTTSGTTSKPIPVFYSKKDVSINENFTEELQLYNVSDRDVVQITVGRCGIFCHLLIGIMRKLGATCFPVDPDIGSLEDHLRNMNQFKVSVLFAYPTIIKKYCEFIENDEKLKPKYLKNIFLAGESWPDSFRTYVRNYMDAEVYDAYGTTETGYIGYGCPQHKGLHPGGSSYIEIIDRTTGKKAKSGEYGEVVLTQLWNKAIPFVRYRTGDIAASLEQSCTCKGSPPLFTRLQGRWDDVINIAGVKFHPLKIEEIIINESKSTPNFQIVLEKPGTIEKIKIVIETLPGKEQENNILRTKLVERISKINADMASLVSAHIIDLPEIEFVPLDSIPRGPGGKIRKVLDQR